MRELASGGMGTVYEAEHTLSRKTVAVKVLFPTPGQDDAATQRWLREVSAPAQIDHPGIVEVTDAGVDEMDGSRFVVMELLRGHPFGEYLHGGAPSVSTLLGWFEAILEPLAAAHEAGFVHRDLKPDNIFVARDAQGAEQLKILDFGIARDTAARGVTATGMVMGTAEYMAPEQAMSAKEVTPAADVWALGVMLYEGLAKQPPFHGDTANAVVMHAYTQPHRSLHEVAPATPAQLVAFVDRCLAKDPAGRPANARQMLTEIRSLRTRIDGLSGTIPAPLGASPSGPRPIAHPSSSPAAHAATGLPQPRPYGAPSSPPLAAPPVAGSPYARSAPPSASPYSSGGFASAPASVPPAAAGAPNPDFCVRCGTRNPSNATICTKCGQALPRPGGAAMAVQTRSAPPSFGPASSPGAAIQPYHAAPLAVHRENSVKFSTVMLMFLGIILPAWPITLPLCWYFAYRSYSGSWSW